MLRWVGFSALLCVLCAAIGLGKIVTLTAGVENFFLAMAALSATVLFSSYDAYETQAIGSDRDD